MTNLDLARPSTRASSWLAEASLNLMTPAALAHGLRLLGIEWSPAAVSADETDDATQGLYVWVDGGERNDSNPTHAPILYIGKAAGVAGLTKRVGDERRWATDEYLHGHARAMSRRKAGVLGGPVAFYGLDRSQLADVAKAFEHLSPASADAFDWLESDPSLILSRTEHIAIRLAIHLGDTGAPVNSHLAGAWDNKSVNASSADLLALYVYKLMTTEAN
jgi:hypothetical protein